MKDLKESAKIKRKNRARSKISKASRKKNRR